MDGKIWGYGAGEARPIPHIFPLPAIPREPLHLYSKSGSLDNPEIPGTVPAAGAVCLRNVIPNWSFRMCNQSLRSAGVDSLRRVMARCLVAGLLL